MKLVSAENPIRIREWLVAWLQVTILSLLSFGMLFWGSIFVFQYLFALVMAIAAAFIGLATFFVTLDVPQKNFSWILKLVPTGILLFISGSWLVLVLLLGGPRLCYPVSLVEAKCKQVGEWAGNGVPERPDCYWRQKHILGLVLIGDEMDTECDRVIA